VARFLSPEWFAELAEQGAGPAGTAPRRPDLVVEVAVAGLAEGELRYQLVVEGEQVHAVAAGEGAWPPELRLATDYETAAGIASGQLSAADALASGRAKVSGDASALYTLAGHLAGLDLLPPALRAATTF
jgi:putative sterol carrier protein